MRFRFILIDSTRTRTVFLCNLLRDSHEAQFGVFFFEFNLYIFYF
ncbi:hypothetical protein LEP1GSC188_4034 [Leptospira weilii serovar Topaz str. LT2116]|uniref:Uncharacterized protein n=1 Tax=Leptospira weilii serovar Topaz str. LT2116 TaxID=1088540 RepID=M3ET87_9LEPT|nr:hypothetical protein LEP1GSC188_4034 [Leptospira weilii serovar Topaz str. LT2116]